MAENAIVANVSIGRDRADAQEVVNVVVSDLHLSAGQNLEVRRKRSWKKRAERGGLPGLIQPQPVITVPNPLEDFHHDYSWDAFLRGIIVTHGSADRVNLRLNGDCLDFHAVTWRGRLADPPFETVAVRKQRIIFRGHKVFFDALTEFLRHSSAQLIVTAGNHDLHLCWPRVQREFIRRVSGGNPMLASKIRFVDHRHDFRDFENGVLYEHGNNAEPHNSVDPKNVIITHRFGKPLKRPILNQPLGSILTLSPVLTLKLRNGLVGSMPEERQIWRHASKHRWLWALYAGFALVRALVYNNLLAFWDYRRKATFAAQLKVVLSTTQGDPVNAYCRRLLRQTYALDEVSHEVLAVVAGHSHGPTRETTPDGTYINTGHWSMRKKLVYPTFEATWKYLQWAEKTWWAFRQFLTPGKIAKVSQFTKLFTFISGGGGVVSFLVTTYGNDERLLTFKIAHLKIVLGILLVLYVIIGMFRVLAVKPEIVHDPLLTFGLIRHGRNGSFRADLKRYVPENETMIDYV